MKRRFQRPVIVWLTMLQVMFGASGALEETIDFSDVENSGIGRDRGLMRHYARVSGFFLTEDGYLVTDKYAILGADRLIVVHENKAHDAIVTELSPAAGFALLKVSPRDGEVFPQAFMTQSIGQAPGRKLAVGGFAVSDEYGAIRQFSRGVIGNVTKAGYELFVTTLPEQVGAIVVNEQGQCEGMLLGTGTKPQTVNRVLRWAEIYRWLPAQARRRLLYVSGGMKDDNADWQLSVLRPSALVLAYSGNADVRKKGNKRANNDTEIAKPDGGKKLTIEDFNTLTMKSVQRKTHYSGNGSGFFITRDGYFITNHHVVDGAEEVVIVHAGKPYVAKVSAKSKDKDLALLKVDGRFVPVRIAGGKTCSVGQTIFAVGYPNIEIQGLEVKVTKGIISSLTGLEGDESLCQMDAAIQPGNSGGPVADETGNIVGATVAQVNKRFANVELANYMIKWDVVRSFLPVGAARSLQPASQNTVGTFVDAVKSVVDATGLVLVYEKGPPRDRSVLMDSDDPRKVERYLRRRILAARSAKLHKEWSVVEALSEEVLRLVPDDAEAMELNALAKTNLGKHLIIRATIGSCDVMATIKPICGFKDQALSCEKVLELYDKDKVHGFPVIARLEYETEGKRYEGTLDCIYDWKGTKEICVKLSVSRQMRRGVAP